MQDIDNHLMESRRSLKDENLWSNRKQRVDLLSFNVEDVDDNDTASKANRASKSPD